MRGTRKEGNRAGEKEGSVLIKKKCSNPGRELIVRAYCLLFVDASSTRN